MVLGSVWHATNANEHESRCHDQHGRNDDERPSPAVLNDRKNKARCKRTEKKGSDCGNDEPPVNRRLVGYRHRRVVGHLHRELQSIIATVENHEFRI